MNELAIVIPAYKKTYFEKTLKSLADQTCKDFIVYVGDDYSPYDLKNIIKKFEDKLDIRYTRFNNNIGAKNLVNQWKRCIDLTHQEQWLWLFSDDDLIDKSCVENFYLQKKLDKEVYDVYRFNTIVIDNEDKIKWKTDISPIYENSEEMAYNLLLLKRGNSMADHIFSRNIYNISGGFVFTHYAQGADWAMSILFSKEKGLVTIPNANFYWRYSNLNISSTTGIIKKQMLKGHLQFINWVVLHFQYLKKVKKEITYSMMINACRANLKSVIIQHYRGFSIMNFIPIIILMRNELQLSYKEIFKDLYQIKKKLSGK